MRRRRGGEIRTAKEVLSVKVCFLLSGDTSADVCHSYPVLLFSGVESQQYGFECSKC